MPETLRVLVTDAVSRRGLRLLEEDERFELVRVDDSGDAAFRDALATAHALVVRSATRVDDALLRAAPELRVVGRAGVGVDNIDLPAATARGVAVINAPAGNTVSAAELTLALLLSLVRRVSAADASVRGGAWERGRFKGAELRGRTLGLVGAGRIGGEVARRARAFGMRVLAFDPYLAEERAADLGIEPRPFEEVLEEADVISFHVPLTDATRGMLDAAAIGRMKEGAYVVNVARGGVVDEDALAEALRSGRLGGAALDVFSVEPLPADSPLRDAPNLVLTPHLGASTQEAQERVAEEIAAAVRAALAEGDLSGALNAPRLSGEAMRTLAPLFDLGRRLGRLACAVAPGGIRGIEIRYRGDSEEALRPLSSFVKVGLLEQVLGADRVNFVSAPHLALQRGIEVTRTRLARHADYSEYVEVTLGCDGGEVALAGALLGESHPRLVRIDAYHVDIPPRGTLLLLRNRDVPGVIGRVGTLLGELGINIAEYHQARVERGGEALAAVAVDGAVDARVRQAILDVDEVSWAVAVDLDG